VSLVVLANLNYKEERKEHTVPWVLQIVSIVTITINGSILGRPLVVD
jgi:hypothetical protein